MLTSLVTHFVSRVQTVCGPPAITSSTAWLVGTYVYREVRASRRGNSVFFEEVFATKCMFAYRMVYPLMGRNICLKVIIRLT